MRIETHENLAAANCQLHAGLCAARRPTVNAIRGRDKLTESRRSRPAHLGRQITTISPQTMPHRPPEPTIGLACLVHANERWQRVELDKINACEAGRFVGRT
jgi:hypothetical protein